MKSPFPGMDPYLERHWEDVHTRLISYVADALQPQLAEDLIARMEEKVYVEDESDGDVSLRKPDVRVVDAPVPWRPHPGTAPATIVADEPIRLQPLGDPIRQRSVLIYDVTGKRIVTAIEILSPWNKSPRSALRTYLKKRSQYLNSDVNLVEIDLVRAGDWTKMVGRYLVPKDAITTYRVTVTNAEEPEPYLYPIPLQARLPTIKVPLRPQDESALLNLQELIERAYLMGRYNRVDYTQPCDPPLQGSDKEWAEQILATRASNAGPPDRR
jgi:hypothetical protein